MILLEIRPSSEHCIGLDKATCKFATTRFMPLDETPLLPKSASSNGINHRETGSKMIQVLLLSLYL